MALVKILQKRLNSKNSKDNSGLEKEKVLPKKKSINKPDSLSIFFSKQLPIKKQDHSKTLKLTLNNGLSVILHQISVIDMVSVFLRVNTGSNYEGQFLGSGISHFLEHCMFLGSKKFPKKDEFSNLIQSYGGIDLNAFTGETTTCYQFSVLSHFVIQALEALHDFIFHPLIRKKDIEEERGTIISEMDIYDDKSADWFYRLIFSRIFVGQPDELPIIGLRKLFHQITPGDLRKYHRQNYRPDNICLSLVGQFDISKVKKFLKETFEANSMPTVNKKSIPNSFYPGGQRGYWNSSSWSNTRSETSSVMQVTETSHYRVKFVRGILVWEICDFYHSDNYTLDIFSHILASGQGSILHELLKEKLEWVEKVSSSSFQTHPHSSGRFFIEFTLPQSHSLKKITSNINQVVEKIHRVLKQLGRYFTEEMLDGSKNTFLKAFIDEKEDFIDVASTLSHSLSYYGHLNYENEYFTYINNLNHKDILDTVKKYFRSKSHLFLLLPENIFSQGEVYPASPLTERIIHDIPDFEEKLERGIADYTWNTVSPQEVKLEQTPSILSVHTPLPTSRIELNNGAVLLHKKITGLPKVSLQLVFSGGSSWEGTSRNTYKNGSFNLISHMFFASNRGYSKKEITKTLRHNGVVYNSFSGENIFGLGFSFLSDHFPDLLSCLEFILNNTRYRESDFIKEKNNIIYSLKKSREDSFREAMREFKKYFFGNSGYALDPKGDENIIPSITSQEIMSLKKRFVVGSQLTAHLCGDFTPTDVKRVQKSLSTLDQGHNLFDRSSQESDFTKLQYHGNHSIILSEDPGGQTHFLMGYRVPALGEGNGALKLVSHYLEGIGGELFKLRSNNFIKDGKDLGGRCYRLGCFLKSAKYYGMMVFYASFRKEASEEYLWALEAFQKELDRLRNNLIDNRELERAKISMLSDMKTQSIKYDNLALTQGLLEAYGLGHDFGEKEIALLQSLTARDLQEAVNRYLGRDNFLAYVMKPTKQE